MVWTTTGRPSPHETGLGAVLTVPVLFAVMAHEAFGAGWIPELLLNRWVQLALITPVMVYPAGRSTARDG